MTRLQLTQRYPALIAHLLGMGTVHLRLDFSKATKSDNLELSFDSEQYAVQPVGCIELVVQDFIAERDLELIRENGFMVSRIGSRYLEQAGESVVTVLISLPADGGSANNTTAVAAVDAAATADEL